MTYPGDRAGPSAYLRRLVSLPLLFVGAVVLTVVAPVLLLVAFVVDLVTAPRRLPTVRLYGFLLGYLWCEVVGVGLAFGAWLLPGSRARRAQRNHALQHWWAGLLVRLAEPVLGLRLEVDDPDGATERVTGAGDGPIIVLAHHASIVDAVVPAWLFGTGSGYRLRYVLTEGLRWDPSLDIVAHRVPNHFVRRGASGQGGGDRAIADLASGLAADEALILFPAGAVATDRRRARAAERLREIGSRHAADAAGFDHVLPPRPGGTIAALTTATGADVVTVVHHGFEQLRSLRPADLWRRLPLERPVRVLVRRHRAADVPRHPDRALDWAFARWREADAWIAAETDRAATNPEDLR